MVLLFCCGSPFSLYAQNQEICDNAIDDDNDGLIDFQDDDCECEFIEIRSLIPNPSFEERSCCPDQHYRLDCADSWVQAYGMTPDYIHYCGWLGPEGMSVPVPFPDGDGIIGFVNGRVPDLLPIEYDWKEYAGACLLGTMEAGKTYRVEFSLGFSGPLRSPALDFSIYGTPDCENFPFGVNVVLPGCPTNFPNWVKLDSKEIDGGPLPTWVDDYFEFTPDMDINAIAIGGPCEPFDGTITNYYFMDNLIMEETYLFQYQIEASGDPCLDDFTLSVNTAATLSYQWYKDSIALVGETNPTLRVTYGEGNYQVRMIEPDGCRMSPPYLYVPPQPKDTTFVETICEGEIYLDGDFSASEEGNYQYTLIASNGCDSTINLTIAYCDLYIPNVFSPNFDGLNDTFKIYGKDLSDNYTMYIYDRWGNLLFEGLEWDGRVNGKPAAVGVYIYMVQLNDASTDNVLLKGSVSLLR